MKSKRCWGDYSPTSEDIERIAEIIVKVYEHGHWSSKALRVKMLTALFDSLFVLDGQPLTTIGARTLVKACGMRDHMAAVRFTRWLKEEGYLVDLGGVLGDGAWRLQTFSWLVRPGDHDLSQALAAYRQRKAISERNARA